MTKTFWLGLLGLSAGAVLVLGYVALQVVAAATAVIIELGAMAWR